MRRASSTEQPRPFFIAPESPEAIRRRLLLISFFFPPAQASGSLRWQKLSRYLAERGWALDVITLDPSCLQSPDTGRLADLAPGTCVYGVPTRALRLERGVLATWRVYRWLRSLISRGRTAGGNPAATAVGATHPTRPGSIPRGEVRWALSSPRGLIRAYSSWRDSASSGRWARDAATLASRVIDPGVHEAIITSGPPHMVHDAGRSLSRRLGLPFIMDMRDPWSLAERLLEDFASPLWLHLASWYERRAVRDADLVIANTEPFRFAMSARYPEASDRMITVMNGYDEGPVPASRGGDRFLIAYAGAIYLDRDPRILFRAAARVINELRLTPAAFAIEFIGDVEQYGGIPLGQIARDEGLNGFVTVGGSRPHKDALEFLAQAAMLVSLPQDNDLAIPAKIFEYLRFEAWVLALATPESATGLLLAQTGADLVAPDDLDGLARLLRRRFLEHRQGIRPVRLATDERFSRRAQARVLLDAIARCTAGETTHTWGKASSASLA